MQSTRHLVQIMLLGMVAVGCPAAEGPARTAQPWTETFTMTLQDKTRSFVVYDGTSWLVMDAADLKDPAFLAGKDVMLAGKFDHTDSQRAWFFSLDKFHADGRLEHWATRLEGDNLYVFGRITVATPTGTTLTVHRVVAAESDAQIITAKLNGVALEDYSGRLAVAAWAREQAAVQGNTDYWIAAADTIVAQTVAAAAADAATRKDAELIGKAVDWAIDLGHDAGLAARAASQPWLVDAGGRIADQIAKRLRQHGFLWYKDRWHSKTEALTLEFEDRFVAITWRDAEGFFKLGRWAESHADDLPSARDLSYRCYQAGFRGDPNHNGIRRKLGLEMVSGAGGSAAGVNLDGPYQHDSTGVVITGPEGWKRAAKPLEGDVTWLDTGSETAFISAQVIGSSDLAGDFEALWAKTLSPWRMRQGFVELATSESPFPYGSARSLRFSYQEGRYTRFGEVSLGRDNAGRMAVVLTAGFTDSEQANVSSAVLQVLSHVVLAEAVEPGAGAAPPTGEATEGGVSTQPPQ